MRLATIAVLCGCLIAFAPLAHADGSVEKRLNERGVAFEVDEDGDYRVVYNYKDEGRTQLAFVRGETETTRSFVVREVWAPAAHIEKDGISGAKALELLVDSRTNKIGSWEIEGKVLVYVIKLPDDVSGAALEAALDTVATVADDMEIKLTGGKDAY
jgi:hypothetical protein